MPGGFFAYLAYLLLVLAAFGVLIAFVMKKSRQRKKRSIPIQKITSGNAGVFFDSEKNAILIPYVQDRFGMGRATGEILRLEYPYSGEKLGKALRQAMSLSTHGEPGTDEALMSRLGFLSWKEFSQGMRNISVHFQEEQGVVFNTTRRKADGAYQFNQMGFEKTLPPDAGDRELGEVLLALLPRCR